MKEHSANSYDLKQAQQILVSLFPTAEGLTREELIPDEAPQYLRLSKDFALRMASRPSPVTVDSPPELWRRRAQPTSSSFQAGRSASPGA